MVSPALLLCILSRHKILALFPRHVASLPVPCCFERPLAPQPSPEECDFHQAEPPATGSAGRKEEGSHAGKPWRATVTW